MKASKELIEEIETYSWPDLNFRICVELGYLIVWAQDDKNNAIKIGDIAAERRAEYKLGALIHAKGLIEQFKYD